MKTLGKSIGTIIAWLVILLILAIRAITWPILLFVFIVVGLMWVGGIAWTGGDLFAVEKNLRGMAYALTHIKAKEAGYEQ